MSLGWNEAPGLLYFPCWGQVCSVCPSKGGGRWNRNRPHGCHRLCACLFPLSSGLRILTTLLSKSWLLHVGTTICRVPVNLHNPPQVGVDLGSQHIRVWGIFVAEVHSDSGAIRSRGMFLFWSGDTEAQRLCLAGPDPLDLHPFVCRMG